MTQKLEAVDSLSHEPLVEPQTVLLLLSGGKDSELCAELLHKAGHTVNCLCIDGIQGKEKVGAQAVAKKLNLNLRIVHISFFDEETWNPFKLVMRDVAMFIVTIWEAKRVGAKQIATGVKLADLELNELRWLHYALKFAQFIAWCFGLKMIYPVWNAPASIKTRG